MLLFWTIVKAICELVALSYLAMLVVGIFNWSKREGNPVYKLFDLIASPATKIARLITPRMVSDGHTRVVGCFLVFVLWMVSVFEIAQGCRATPQADICQKKLEGRQ